MTKETEASLKKKSLDQIWTLLVNNNLDSAIWRLPNTEFRHLIADFNPINKIDQLNIENSKPGFVLGDFNGEMYYINADFQCTFNSSNTIHSLSHDETSFTENIVESAYETDNIQPNKKTDIEIIEDTNQKENYITKVKKAIDAIQEGKIKKVVLSRQKKGRIDQHFNHTEVFSKLCEAYPSAFVSLVYLSKTKTYWIGATPETLVSIDKDGIFKTMSLAGTQSIIEKNGQTIGVSEARWSQKEIEEQALVSRYIIDCFKKIRLREYIENGPKTVKAGNLLHLRTDYLVDTKSINNPTLASTMLQLLHPTSAVCGMPLEESKNFIKNHEGYDRELYSGFIGPINIHEQRQIFVNLRTMKTQNGIATFYAGAGLTEDSDPEKEWAETEIKINTLLNIIQIK